MAFHVPEHLRRTTGLLGSDESFGNNGVFDFPMSGGMMRAVVSDKLGWEHVSVAFFKRKRCPTWEEMCAIKAMFWDPDDCVVQYHPPESDYVSNHPFCLHLFRSIERDFPVPPSILVGLRKKDVE